MGEKWRQTESSINDHGCHGLSSMLVGNGQRTTTQSVEPGILPGHTAGPGSMTNRLLRDFALNKQPSIFSDWPKRGPWRDSLF